jgi:hypothetical protein
MIGKFNRLRICHASSVDHSSHAQPTGCNLAGTTSVSLQLYRLLVLRCFCSGPFAVSPPVMHNPCPARCQCCCTMFDSNY